MQFDHSTDVLVVGSGGGALTAALTASLLGADALVVEKNELYFHRWRPANVTYLYLFRQREQGKNAAEIPQFDPLITEKERAIAAFVAREGR